MTGVSIRYDSGIIALYFHFGSRSFDLSHAHALVTRFGVEVDDHRNSIHPWSLHLPFDVPGYGEKSLLFYQSHLPGFTVDARCEAQQINPG